MEQYNGEGIDQLIDDTQFVSLDLQTRIMRIETDSEIKEINLDEETDEYDILRHMIHYTLGKDIYYNEVAGDKIAIVCIHSCEDRFNKIINNGVRNGRKITDIAIECCSELAYMLCIVNPLMVAARGRDYIRKSFMCAYPSIVTKVKEARAKLEEGSL